MATVEQGRITQVDNGTSFIIRSDFTMPNDPRLRIMDVSAALTSNTRLNNVAPINYGRSQLKVVLAETVDGEDVSFIDEFNFSGDTFESHTYSHVPVSRLYTGQSEHGTDQDDSKLERHGGIIRDVLAHTRYIPALILDHPVMLELRTNTYKDRRGVKSDLMFDFLKVSRHEEARLERIALSHETSCQYPQDHNLGNNYRDIRLNVTFTNGDIDEHPFLNLLLPLTLEIFDTPVSPGNVHYRDRFTFDLNGLRLGHRWDIYEGAQVLPRDMGVDMDYDKLRTFGPTVRAILHQHSPRLGPIASHPTIRNIMAEKYSHV